MPVAPYKKRDTETESTMAHAKTCNVNLYIDINTHSQTGGARGARGSWWAKWTLILRTKKQNSHMKRICESAGGKYYKSLLV